MDTREFGISLLSSELRMTKKFDWKKPTTQMMGRWQPWHDGHTALFKKALMETGQVCIMCRDVPSDVEANERIPGQDDNPFTFSQVVVNIRTALAKQGFYEDEDYIIMQIPNVVDISYGRGVGYTFTQHDLGADIHEISATKIRAQLRAESKL